MPDRKLHPLEMALFKGQQGKLQLHALEAVKNADVEPSIHDLALIELAGKIEGLTLYFERYAIAVEKRLRVLEEAKSSAP